jgi:hypothetical protein
LKGSIYYVPDPREYEATVESGELSVILPSTAVFWLTIGVLVAIPATEIIYLWWMK